MHMKTVRGRPAPRVVAILFVIAFIATGWIYGQAAPKPYRAEALANRGLDATLYMQTAAEYRASCYQAYKWAAIQLEALVKARKPTASKPFAVIMDLDETVLDNSRFQAMLLRNGLAWDADLWKQWERDHSEDVTLIPGAKEFIEKAAAIEKELGSSVDVFFVSNRNGKEFKQQAQDLLTGLGVPPKDPEHLKLVLDPDVEDSQNKTARFQEVRDRYDVLLYVGDNLRDFSEELAFDKLGFGKVKKAPEEKLTEIIQARRDKIDSGQIENRPVRDRFGNDWIIIPNPSYGDWKAPLGRGESDFNRLIAAVFPVTTPSASPSPSAHKECLPKKCLPKKCTSSREHTRNIDPAIVAAVIAFLSAAALFFWQKWLERRSINRAILAEIRRILIVVRTHRDWWATRVHDEDTDHPLIPFSHDVYSKQVTNIGALTNRLVGRAVTFYGYLGFINSLQKARPKYLAKGKGAEFDKRYLGVLTTFLGDYEHAFDQDFERD
jgi:5'-nucleotidase (lipoprotein e(P4) family)